jgi:uroporphyrinogen-III decarboxylase
VDTQRTLPFGSSDEVRKEVCDRLKAFGPGGGFVFNTIHNVQARVPIANVQAMYETLRECGKYPLH